MKNTILIIWAVGLLGFLQLGRQSSAPGGSPKLRLRESGLGAQMIEHPNGDRRPFFRVNLNIVDEKGEIVPFKMPPGDAALTEAIEITKDGQNFHPFSVIDLETKAVGAEAQPRRNVLLLMDISGSMNATVDGGRTRFEAAKSAANGLLQNFEDGVDSIAVAPFESHDVRARIRAARFVSTRTEAEAQIAGLPKPGVGYNTALYSATVEALEVLKEKRRKDPPGQQYVLIVLSDGENDVDDPEDEPGLIDDSTVVEKSVREANITTYTVGFGAMGDDFKRVLERIAFPNPDNYSSADNTQSLIAKFKVIRQSMTQGVRITFYTKDTDYRELKTKVTFRVRFKPPLQQVESQDINWHCRATACSPDGVLDRTELKALAYVPPPMRTFWQRMPRQLLILGSFSALLALLWFVPPRLMWPRPRLPRPAGVERLERARDLASRVPRRPSSPPQRPGSASARRGGEPPSPPRKRFDETVVLKNPDERFNPRK